jgi:fimbrial isopeptide formation D2 family protein
MVANNDSFSESVSSPNDGTVPVYVNWTLGTANNSDVTINFNATIADAMGNQNGVVISANNVTFCYKDANGIQRNISNESGSITVVESDLQIEKIHNDADGVIEAGDIVNYTITVNHTSSSDTDAYDVRINDTVPEGLKIISSESNPQANQTMQSGNNLSWSYYKIARGTTAIINYTVSVTGMVGIDETLLNNATLTWTSTNGTNPNERYGNQTDQALLQVNDSVSITKTPDYPREATIGESVNFTIFVDLPNATLYNECHALQRYGERYTLRWMDIRRIQLQHQRK